ncbi:MAG: hypothetical protein PHH04_04040 [Thomasclavelia sp.]|nr:hypothetical protein [Thomasclavelia sp.]
MKKVHNIILFTISLFLIVSLIGCSTKQNSKAKKKHDIDIDDALILNNSYTTKTNKFNPVTPIYSFSYPDGYRIFKDSDYYVEIKNNNGLSLRLMHYSVGMNDLSDNVNDVSLRYSITYEGECFFKPTVFNNVDYSSLGDFMIGKVKITGQQTGSGYEDLDGDTCYCILPTSRVGEYESNKILDNFNTFDYAGAVSIYVTTSTGTFTKQQKREALALLYSFKEVRRGK